MKLSGDHFLFHETGALEINEDSRCIDSGAFLRMRLDTSSESAPPFRYPDVSLLPQQKFQFKNNPNNKGKFMDSGLWSLSRHPNYLGEMGVWWALLGVALPALK